MKTKDMIIAAEAYCSYLNDKSVFKSIKYRVEVNDEEILIRSEEKFGSLRVWVSRKLTNMYEFHMISNVEYDECQIRKIIRSLIEYSKTPLKEREDEQRWHIHLLEDSDEYLNLYKDPYIGYKDPNYKGHYMLSDKDEGGSYQTKFTRSDIEDWAGTNSDEVVDWIIDKFGEEVK